MSGKSGYAPRNALNAEALKSDIFARSAARGDAQELREWLTSHFFRHVVGNFEPATPVASFEDALARLAPAPPPEWVARFFAAIEQGETRAPLVWIDPAAPELLQLESRLVEFLASRRGTALEGKLMRVNCPQALALWEKEHAAIAEKRARGWRQSDPDATLLWRETENGQWVEFLADAPQHRAEMAFETYAMRHCVGQFADKVKLTGGYGEEYAQALEQGRMRLFSFRAASGRPHITLACFLQKNGKWRVDQLKGKQNRPPVARYLPDALDCLNALDTDDEIPADCLNIGIVKTRKGWHPAAAVTDASEQLRLVNRFPSLFPYFAAPAPAVEWIAVAKNPEVFAQRPPASPALRRTLALAAGELGAAPKTDEEEKPKRGFDPWSLGNIAIAFVLWSIAMKLGAPQALLWLCFVCWFAYGLWHMRKTWNDEDEIFDGEKGFPLALALPMVAAQKQTGFFDREAHEMTLRTVAYFRSPFLHYMECRTDLDDDGARAHLVQTLEKSWYRADLYKLTPDEDPRAALAFAACRMAFFVRNAALMGWTSPEAAWRVLLLNAERAREIFTSWEDFAEAYRSGRRQWLAAYRADPFGQSLDDAGLRKLLSDKTLPWARRSPWIRDQMNTEQVFIDLSRWLRRR
ncbi:MAG: DUF1266 domain-containing protein [Candidatus Accumulibacter sp.]|nr:DUF1266 domain-containing protein [Accumulibacter sp.]